MVPPSETGPSAAARADAGANRPLTAEVDRYLAAPMWCVTVVWMVCLAGGLQELRGAPTLPAGTSLYWWGMLLLWSTYLVELVVHLAVGSPNLRYNVLYLLLPPLRLGGRDHATWCSVWLPGALWQRVDRDLVVRVEKALSGPMVGFALLILPLLVIEVGWKELVAQESRLKFALETTSSVIWLSFAMELTVMVSIVRRKMQYLAQHWIDLAIVLLPMVQVLPALRLATLARLGRLGRLSQVYRTRGIATRAFRALLLLDSVQRLLHLNPEKRLAALRDKLEDQYYAIERIQAEMRELEARIAAGKRADALVDAAAVAECELVSGEQAGLQIEN
jgi:hypothetical protein